MPSKKLTQKTVDRMKAPDPSGRQTMFWDNSMRGFGVRVSGSTNQKSYIAQRTLPNGKDRRVTIGSTEVLARRGAAKYTYLLSVD
jgi:hypothetical protein